MYPHELKHRKLLARTLFHQFQVPLSYRGTQ